MLAMAFSFGMGTLWAASNTGSANQEDSLHGKVMCGYQGWFTAPGDYWKYNVNWRHWCFGDTEPKPNTITFDSWPDYSEYPEDNRYFPATYSWKYPDGSPAGFYSSNHRETVLLHCKWMRDYGIDGVFMQRFTSSLQESSLNARYNTLLNYMIEGAGMYGLKIAIMYDITGTLSSQISDIIANDWNYLVNVMKLTEKSCYQFHPNKNGQSLPVVAVWGFGFLNQGDKNQAAKVTGFFKSNSNPSYRATLMGGVPGYWRFGNSDSQAGYENVYAGFDILSPWTVGRYGTKLGVLNWRRQRIEKDLELANNRNQDYLPVCFPGFSNSYLRKNYLDTLTPDTAGTGQSGSASSPVRDLYLNRTMQGEFNKIRRDGGNFLWSQFYHWHQANTKMLYVAMFDEVDEATAIFKLAANPGNVPVNTPFVHLGIDGYNLKSDHYLWVTGAAAFIFKNNLRCPEIQPLRIENNSFIVERIMERAWLVEKHFAKIDINVNVDSYSRFIIYRKENNGNYQEFKSLQKEELQDGSSFSFLDSTVTNETGYTFMMVAFNAEGLPVGFSNRITI